MGKKKGASNGIHVEASDEPDGPPPKSFIELNMVNLNHIVSELCTITF
jgi:hypothetical protein